MIYGLWNILRTTLATNSRDISNERRYFSTYVVAGGILMTINLKKIRISNEFLHFYFLTWIFRLLITSLIKA